VYRFPKELAAKIAVSTAMEFIKEDEFIEEVIFVCFGDENYKLYCDLLEQSN
jgi:O-acetyl-ADP-ribose deacetylase